MVEKVKKERKKAEPTELDKAVRKLKSLHRKREKLQTIAKEIETAEKEVRDAV